MTSEIRVNSITNRSGLSTVTWNDEGLNVVGVVTATSFVGNVTGTASQLETNATGANLTLSGNLGVGGTITYEDVARVDATGISTFREGFGVGPLAGIALTAYKDGSIRTSGVITATTYYGSGANLTGIDATQIVTGNTSVQTVDTGSDGHVKVTTEGTERLRITSNGDVTIPVDNKKFLAGAGNDARMFHDGSDSYFDSITGNLYVYNHASGNLDLGTAGNTRFRINASGSFGIGGSNYGSSGQVIKSAGSGAAPAWGAMAFSSFAVICDKKGVNNDGGSATAGNYAVYDVRNLNYEMADPDSIVSISSNQFTLVAGTYWVEWKVPAYGVDMFTAELINVTDGTGNRGSAPGKCNTDSVTYCHGSSYFTISASKTFEIRQHNQTARSGNGLGVRAGYSNSSINETFYTFVYIYKK